MDYYSKYQKYKSKYLQLKYGAGKAEYLYHGTSMFYADRLKTIGLTGKYDPELFSQMNTFYPIISNGIVGTTANTYFPGFIKRQESGTSLSFTGDLRIAKEYAGGARVIGEGPTFFTHLFRDYLNKHKKEESELLTNMRSLHEILSRAIRYPSLILAIKVNDFEDIKRYDISDDIDEYTIHYPITADKLWVYEPIKKEYMPITSDQFDVYYREKMVEFDKKEIERQIEMEEKEKLLKDWREDGNLGTGYKIMSHSMVKKDILIETSYEASINDNRELQYLQIFALKDGKNLINVSLKLHDNVNIRNNNSIDKEMTEKLNLVINRMLIEIKDQKEYYINHLKRIFPFFVLT